MRPSQASSGAQPPHRGTRRFAQRVASVIRWLHLYISMFGFAALLFFSVTGITLNHPEWFASHTPRLSEFEGTLDAAWLASGRDEAAVDKLRVVEHLRSTHAVRGSVAEFRVDDGDCFVSFKAPGYLADAFIDRASGGYELTIERQGAITVLNELHQGRDTGGGWSLVIDLAAVLMIASALTGLVLLWYIKRRRATGLVTLLVGVAAIVLLAIYLVP